MGQHSVAIYINANSKGKYYDPTGRSHFLRAYVNFTKKHCHRWTYNTVRVQEEGSTVFGHHWIFYLIHRCTGHSMTDVTRLLENPVKATTIEKKFALLLVRHVLWKKYGRKASRNVKRLGKYKGKVSWIVKRYVKYRRNPSWIVKRYGKYGRKFWNDMKNMEEM